MRAERHKVMSTHLVPEIGLPSEGRCPAASAAAINKTKL